MSISVSLEESQTAVMQDEFWNLANCVNIDLMLIYDGFNQVESKVNNQHTTEINV